MPTEMPPVFTDIGAALYDVGGAALAWGDYDNDGDLDLALSGFSPPTGDMMALYRNDAGVFNDTHTPSLGGLRFGSLDWGDYDKDGDLDLLVTGYTSYAGGLYLSGIYRNDNGSFVYINVGLPGISLGEARWGDYDNDGDLDILLAGSIGSSVVAAIYENNGGAFTNTNISLTGVSHGAANWVDYNSDNDLDIFLSGQSDSGYVTLLYNNSGGDFSEVNIGLPGLSESAAAWGDYDNDGDPDLLFQGIAQYPVQVAALVRNDNGTFTDSGIILPPVRDGSFAWADYNLDGYLDFVLTGLLPGSNEIISYLYTNNGDGTFTSDETLFTGVAASDAVWGDYDGDGLPDLALAGYTSYSLGLPQAIIYHNNFVPVEPYTATPTTTEIVTETATPTPTITATNIVSPTTTSVVTSTATYTPTDTYTPTITDTPTPTPTNTGTPTDTPTVTEIPTETGTVTNTPTITGTPTITPSPTRTPTATQTYKPTRTPKFTRTPRPTKTPGWNGG